MARPATGQVVVDTRRKSPVFALRFRAYGKRRYVTLGTKEQGWSDDRAKEELQNVLADVRRGIWRPPEPAPVPEEPQEEPIFWDFAREWLQRREHEVDARTVEHWAWALNCHLRDAFGRLRLSQITVQAVDGFKAGKVRERHELDEARRRGQKVVGRGLSHGSINKALKVLAQILDDAVEGEYMATNPARGKKRRLKAKRPQRTWLELHEVNALLRAAGRHRALLAAMIFAGLRVGELTNLRWRAVDLAGGRLTVEESKTDAGEGRVIDLSPGLLDELKLHRADSRFVGRDDFVFATRKATRRNRSNLTRQILAPAVEKANAALVEAGKPPLAKVTNHSLRRTFASLLYEAGANPPYVMSQMGHTSSALALEVYAKVMERKRDTGERMDALVRAADWAAVGSNGIEEALGVLAPGNEKAA
ncbi:MAG: site-specific integrase [Actinobacteria bacterium]|nr:MAG: site-specific integrase [Actinomycetota bacterium]